jgi:hypothetical protein
MRGGAVAQRNDLTLGSRPQAIIYTSETLYPAERVLIEETFGCKTVSEYSSVEVGTIAYECPEGNLHVCDEMVYLELVDAMGRPVVGGLAGWVLLLQRIGGYAFLLSHLDQRTALTAGSGYLLSSLSLFLIAIVSLIYSMRYRRTWAKYLLTICLGLIAIVIFSWLGGRASAPPCRPPSHPGGAMTSRAAYSPSHTGDPVAVDTLYAEMLQ